MEGWWKEQVFVGFLCECRMAAVGVRRWRLVLGVSNLTIEEARVHPLGRALPFYPAYQASCYKFKEASRAMLREAKHMVNNTLLDCDINKSE